MMGRNPSYEGNLGGYGIRPLFADGRWRVEVQSARGYVLHTTEDRDTKDEAIADGRDWLRASQAKAVPA